MGWKRKNGQFVLEDAKCLCRVNDRGYATCKDPSGEWYHLSHTSVEAAKADCEEFISSFLHEQTDLKERRFKYEGRDKFVVQHKDAVDAIRHIARAVHMYAMMSPPDRQVARKQLLNDTSAVAKLILKVTDNNKVLKAALGLKESWFVDKVVDNFIRRSMENREATSEIFAF